MTKRRAHEALHEHCTAQLARYKAPKEFIVVEQVKRLGNGKADYRWAKETAHPVRFRLSSTRSRD